MSYETDLAIINVTVVLRATADWEKWFLVRKDAAAVLDVLEYVDPSTPEDELPQLEEPTEPTPASVKAGAATYAELSATEREEYRWLDSRYNMKLREYRTKKRAIREVGTQITLTLAPEHLYMIWDEPTVYGRFKKLQRRFAPTDATRRRELVSIQGSANPTSWL